MDQAELSADEIGGLSSLEQMQNFCITPRRPFLKGLNEMQKKAVFFKPRCKLWSCPPCAEINKKLWAIRAYNGAEVLMSDTHQISFLTLTSHEKLDPSGSLRVWPKAWAKLRERARYQTGGFNYLLVPEQHEDHRLHVHAIETAGLGTRWWKDNARACGLGFMAEEEAAQTAGGAAYYCIKYLTKSIEWQDWPKGFRRVRTSRQWPKLPESAPLVGWRFEALPKLEQLQTAVNELKRAGYEVQFLDHSSAWEYIKQEEM